MLQYLNNIPNWELYKAIDRGNILYEIKSDNLIEIAWAWLKDCRSYVTPFYVLKTLLYKNMERINTIIENSNLQNKVGLTKRFKYFFIILFLFFK